MISEFVILQYGQGCLYLLVEYVVSSENENWMTFDTSNVFIGVSWKDMIISLTRIHNILLVYTKS